MSKHTHHFDWKKLEEKPENWETLRHLIGLCNTIDDVYEDKTETTNQWTVQYLDLFRERMIQRYGSNVAVFFPSPPSSEKEEKKKKKGNKKTANLVRQRIHMETDRKMIEKDLEMIRIDASSRPMMVRFRLQPTFSFMIAEWILFLWSRPCEKKDVIVDAMISIDRIYREEIKDNALVAVPVQSFFETTNRKAQDLLGREFVFEQLFSHYPELMVHPFSQKREGQISLYKEQIRLLERVVGAVLLDRPILIGDRMPPGTGKTFLTVPLTQKLVALHSNKTILFACQNQLVRTDVATTALLGKNLHLWMGVFDAMNDEYLIRPYKSCFPNTWKKVYKTQDADKTGSVLQQFAFYKNATGKYPDLLVADLDTCLALLQEPSLKHQFVAYIDEFVSDDKANSIMVRIAEHLPRQTILLSAILPRFEDMPSLVQHFMRRHEAAPEDIVRIEANQLTISCTIVDPDGLVALPHHFIDSVDQIPLLLQRIREDPLIGRMYSPQQVFLMMDHIQDLLPTSLLFEESFPTISLVDHAGVRDYILRLLEHVKDHPVLFERMRTFRPRIMEAPRIAKIATEDSHHFIGKTLVITSQERMFPLLQTIHAELHENAPPLRDILASIEREEKELRRKIESIRDRKKESKSRIDPIDMQIESTKLEDQLASLQRFPWPEEMIVNSLAHARRYGHTLRKPAINPNLPQEYQEFPDLLFMLLLSGIGVYDFSQCTAYHRRLTMKILKQLSLLFAGKEIVFGTNIEGLTHLFIDGEFGDHVSRNVLFQLIGRAGRMGQSYQALVVLNSPPTLRTIMRFDDQKDADAQYFDDYFRALA